MILQDFGTSGPESKPKVPRGTLYHGERLPQERNMLKNLLASLTSGWTRFGVPLWKGTGRSCQNHCEKTWRLSRTRRRGSEHGWLSTGRCAARIANV